MSKITYCNNWFNIIAIQHHDIEEPYYALECPDYVHVIPLNIKKKIVLVRQFRPVINSYTLEFPGGHVEDAQSPDMSAKQELYEETGYESQDFKLIGYLHSDVGRLTNKVWCYFCPEAHRSNDWTEEEGIEVIHYSLEEIPRLIEKGVINNAYNIAEFYMAIKRGFLECV